MGARPISARMKQQVSQQMVHYMLTDTTNVPFWEIVLLHGRKGGKTESPKCVCVWNKGAHCGRWRCGFKHGNHCLELHIILACPSIILLFLRFVPIDRLVFPLLFVFFVFVVFLVLVPGVCLKILGLNAANVTLDSLSWVLGVDLYVFYIDLY